MKTKFTAITTFVLFALGIAAHAEGTKSEIGRQYFIAAKKGLQGISKTKGEFKHLYVSGNQLSVPGYSEDFSWDEDLNDWHHDSNTTYTYDDAGRLTEEIAQEAETDIYLTRISYAYDIPGNITEEVSYVMGFDEWTPVSGDKSVYMINDDSQFSGVIKQTLENGSWVNTTKIVYVLNSYAIPIGILTYNWDGNDWMLYSKTMNITWADWSTRELAAYTIQYWHNQDWLNGERYSSQYDGENYTATNEIWENGAWVNSTRETYSITEIQEELILENWTEQGWEKSEKYQGTFDYYGNPTGMFYSSWYETGWELDMELFFDLLYNESNDVTEMVFRYRDPELSEPVNISKYKYSSFLHFTTDVPEVSVLNNVKVFPNPVSTTFTVQIDENKITNYQVNILTAAGQTVFSNNYSNPFISINTEKFAPGMYLLNIKTDDGKIHNSKLLKQ